MGSFLKILGIIFILVLLVGVLVLGYFGFVPGVSAVFGSNKPRDLGMEFSQEKFDEALTKAEVELKKQPAESTNSISYEGSHPVKASFSDEELTAHGFNKDWEYYPVQDLQVRINDDDTCEISGVIRADRLEGFFTSVGFSPGDYQAALEKAKIPLKNLPFYAKGYGSANNNQLDLNLTNFEIGRFPVPQNIISENKGLVEEFGYTIIRNIPGFSVNEARFENGAIYFDGNLPDIEYTN